MGETIKVAPSILAANTLRLGEELSKIEKEIDLLHVDIMDGHFVPNLSFGPKLVKDIKESFPLLPLEIHLMVENPGFWVDRFAESGGDILIFHWEVEKHPLRLIRSIKEAGKKSGVAFNPATLWEEAKLILHEVDYVLMMSVEPGFSGQTFIPWVLDKVRSIREFRDRENLCFEIVVDGGVGPSNASQLRKAGATVLVGGASIFQNRDPVSVIRALRGDINYES
ncbi:MAG: ribulose-phosphate 3-epimerase [Synergistetes bacterium]|nr:MAG: Ribulose-phosphate 3-epimerase [bacterium 42_11]MBC7331860.1 ribulose-phosphate 3-epimerase [Synergistota bacterium]MDK2871720.1 ribulose-phosphate 3-epimerase [bacterium]